MIARMMVSGMDNQTNGIKNFGDSQLSTLNEKIL